MYFHRTNPWKLWREHRKCTYGMSMCVRGVHVHVHVRVAVCVCVLSIVMGQKTQAGRANIKSRTLPRILTLKVKNFRYLSNSRFS